MRLLPELGLLLSDPLFDRSYDSYPKSGSELTETTSGSSRHDHDGRDREFGHVWQEIMVSDGHHTNVIYFVTRKY